MGVPRPPIPRTGRRPARKDFAMKTLLVPLLRVSRPLQPESQNGLITCSLCLRVRRGAEWIEPEYVIRELRSYELAAPPHLQPAVCEDCAEAIFSRRAHREPLAA
jgi:hypothetical protein